MSGYAGMVSTIFFSESGAPVRLLNAFAKKTGVKRDRDPTDERFMATKRAKLFSPLSSAGEGPGVRSLYTGQIKPNPFACPPAFGGGKTASGGSFVIAKAHHVHKARNVIWLNQPYRKKIFCIFYFLFCIHWTHNGFSPDTGRPRSTTRGFCPIKKKPGNA